MFTKFNNKLVDVSNCYFEQDKTLNTEGDTNIEEHRIMCCAMKQESIDEEVYLLVESYSTQAEADKRFLELESMLCRNPVADAIDNLLERIEQIEAIKFSEQLYKP